MSIVFQLFENTTLLLLLLWSMGLFTTRTLEPSKTNLTKVGPSSGLTCTVWTADIDVIFCSKSPLDEFWAWVSVKAWT